MGSIDLGGRATGEHENKTVVPTIGATGIAGVAARCFFEAGAIVFLLSRQQDALDAAMAELRSGSRAAKRSIPTIVSIGFTPRKAERGIVDTVFANAGVRNMRSLEKTAVAQVNGTLGIHLD